MNKKAIATFAFAIAIGLTGCSSNKVETKKIDNESVLLSVDDTNYFAYDAFKEILTSTESNQIAYLQVEKMVVSQSVEITQSMKDTARLYTDNYSKSMKNLELQSGEKAAKEQKQKDALTLKQFGFEKGLDDLYDYFIYQSQREVYTTQIALEKTDLLDVKNLKTRRVRHVLIKIADIKNPTEEELNKVKAVEEKIAQGVDLGTIALEYSDDTSKEQGGDLGIMDTNTQYVEPFKTIALALPKGIISSRVETQYGYHWIEVTADTKEELLMTKNEKVTIDYLLKQHPEIVYLSIQNTEVEYFDEDFKKLVDSYIKKAIEDGGKN